MIRQVYWRLGNGWFLRLRRTGPVASCDDEVTIKGPREGWRRPEFEFRLKDARQPRSTHPDATGSAFNNDEIIKAVTEIYKAGLSHLVVKTRHSYLSQDKEPWDIDEFHRENEGLFIAEIEMGSLAALDNVLTPTWSLREVTGDRRFNNEELAFNPWNRWKEKYTLESGN
jgi:CYTH domain-containing protein